MIKYAKKNGLILYNKLRKHNEFKCFVGKYKKQNLILLKEYSEGVAFTTFLEAEWEAGHMLGPEQVGYISRIGLVSVC